MSVVDPAAELSSLAAQLRARIEGMDETEVPRMPGDARREEVSAALPAGSAAAGKEYNLSREQGSASSLSVSGGTIASSGKDYDLSRGAGRDETLAAMRAQVSACRKCPLGSRRLNPAFGVGAADAAVMFVGEGPGFAEDHRGEPFVGKAGRLLDKILESIGLSRRAVYIANVVKCHPMVDPSNPEARGNDRPPTPEEIAACRPYLDEQIRLIGPRVVVTLGGVAAKALLGEDVRITRVRGQWREYRLPGSEKPIKLLPTFHPAALLRDPALKRDVWTDMKNLKKELEGFQ